MATRGQRRIKRLDEGDVLGALLGWGLLVPPAGLFGLLIVLFGTHVTLPLMFWFPLAVVGVAVVCWTRRSRRLARPDGKERRGTIADLGGHGRPQLPAALGMPRHKQNPANIGARFPVLDPVFLQKREEPRKAVKHAAVLLPRRRRRGRSAGLPRTCFNALPHGEREVLQQLLKTYRQ